MTHGDPAGLLGLSECHESRKNWGMLKSSGISGHSPCTERNSWIESGFIICARVCGYGGKMVVDGVRRGIFDEGGACQVPQQYAPAIAPYL